ncbi:MAG: hypothetical protein L6N95_02365 [Candidatus Methylarchaceae archaeon HK01B]|nr:hypothetical protein [Candidatus Methylarchaceae archaeon HK01B]
MSEECGDEKRRTYEDKDQKIRRDDAIVLTADEFIKTVEDSGLEKDSNEVDVVTTGTYGRRLTKKWRRPHLEIDFKEQNKIKPYIDVKSGTNFFYEPTSKFLRMVIKNLGRTPATYCEAKLTITLDGIEQFQGTPHWVKRDSTISQSLDDLFAPITINAKDSEELDVLRLRMNADKIETASRIIAYIEPRRTYQLKVSIFTGIGNNPTKSFDIRWDGTYDGFDRCVQ